MTRLDIGFRVPMSTSALGRAYLLDLDERLRADLMDRMARTHGTHWASIRQNIDSSLRKARKLGYCLSLGELYPDIHSIARAIPSPTGDTVVLNCGGPSSFLSSQMIASSAGPALLDTVQKLTRAMGHLK